MSIFDTLAQPNNKSRTIDVRFPDYIPVIAEIGINHADFGFEFLLLVKLPQR